MELINYLQYNSVLILTFFFISFVALILKYITLGASNKIIFSSFNKLQLWTSYLTSCNFREVRLRKLQIIRTAKIKKISDLQNTIFG